MSCPTDEELAALLEGQADAAQRDALGGHVVDCASCRRLLGELGRDDADPLSGLLVGQCTSEYMLAGPLGKGGMGVVYRANDLHLKRSVAVKLLHPPAADDAPTDPSEARFMREALITARLQHPSIVPVYQGGRWPTGEPFYAMRIVGGRSFKEVVAEAKSPNERLALLPHLIAVAEAIAYAHSEGVVHRDLKPDNVLVGRFGETVVADWGLARDLRSSDVDERSGGANDRGNGHETLAGTVLGTPAYMPPEQAAGSPVDERADVYALGALLYFMIAGVPPYAGDDARAIVRQVLAVAPPSLAEHAPRAPADLLAIVDKAMARDPARRYPDAAALASDLKRLQAGQLVAASRYSAWTLTRRWMQRHRGPLVTAAVLLSVLVATLVVGVRRIVAEKGRAEARGDRLILTSARAAMLRDPTAALAWLKSYPLAAADWAEARDIALDAERLGVARHVFPRDQSFAAGDFSPDGRSFAAAGPNLTLVVRRLSDGQQTAILRNAGDAFQIRFCGDDTVVWVNLGDPVLRLWHIGESTPSALTGHRDMIRALDVSANGTLVVTGSDDATVRLWDLPTKSSRVLIQHDGGRVAAVRFSHDGRRVFSAGVDGTVRFANIDGTGVAVLHDGHVALTSLAISEDDRIIAFGAIDGTVHWIDRQASTFGSYRAHESATVNDVDISRDGRFIASAGENKTVALYDLTTRRAMTLVGHTQPVDSVSFSAAQGVLASAARDGNIVLWRLDGTVRRVLRGHIFTTLARFSPGGTRIASMSADKTTRIWDVHDEGREVMQSGSGHVLRVVFAPDGASLATSTRDGIIRVWNGDHARTLSEHVPDAWALIYSGDGRWLLAASLDGTVRGWELATGAEQVLADHCGSLWALAAEPNSARIAAAGADGVVRLIDLTTRQTQLLRGHDGAVQQLAFARGRLASSGSDGTIRLWGPAGEPLRALTGHRGEALNIQFSPDGQTLASTGADRTVRLWNVADGTSRMLDAPPFPLIPLRFSPDGNWLAAAGQGDYVRLWALPSGKTFDLRGHTDQILRLAFTPDGKLLASASFDYTVRIWSLQTKLPVAVLGHSSCVMDCAFDPRGRSLATVTADHLLELWTPPFDHEVPTSAAALREWAQARTTAAIGAREQPSTP